MLDPATLHPPRRRVPLDDPLQLTRRPASVKVSRLRLHQFPIHVAIPRPGIERHVTLQILECRRRTLVTPDPISDDLLLFLYFFTSCRKSDGVVGCPAFPLAEGGFLACCQGDGDGGRRQVISYFVSAFSFSFFLLQKEEGERSYLEHGMFLAPSMRLSCRR